MTLLIFVAMVAVVMIILYVGIVRPMKHLHEFTSSADYVVANTMERLRGLEFEVGVVVDPSGEIVGEYTQYDPNRIRYTDETITFLKARTGLISIHNHNEDIPPSIDDLLFAAVCNFAMTVIVSPNYTYIVVPGETGWKTPEEVEDIVNENLDLFGMIQHGINTVGIAQDGAHIVETACELVSTDQAIQVLTEKLGYRYMRKAVLQATI